MAEAAKCDRRLSIAVWERWAQDCNDPYFRRLDYPSQSSTAKLERDSKVWDRPTDYESRQWERMLPETGALAEQVAHFMSILDVDQCRLAMAVRARWHADTDERMRDVARREGVSTARASQLANEGERWVEFQIYG